jgi:PhnB protein
MFGARPDWPDTPGFLRLYVADDAAVLRRAVERGATVITEPTEMSWGDRVSRFRDPFDNLWWIHQRVAEPDPADAERLAQEPRFVRAMEYMTSAQFFPDRP